MSDGLKGGRRAVAERVAGIVCAYVSNNRVPRADLPALIASVHASLARLASRLPDADAQPKASPAQIRKSITPDALISFIDGKPYKALKKHIRRHHLEPHAYRTLYGLPEDYPMVAPSYSARRSEISNDLVSKRRGPSRANDVA